MSNAHRFQLDEITIRPGTYFNPQTEVLIVVDDSPEVDHEIFNMDDFDGGEWVLISEDSPVDENKRDELVDQFEVTYQPGGESLADEDRDDELDDEGDEEEDELEVEELELDPE